MCAWMAARYRGRTKGRFLDCLAFRMRIASIVNENMYIVFVIVASRAAIAQLEKCRIIR